MGKRPFCEMEKFNFFEKLIFWQETAVSLENLLAGQVPYIVGGVGKMILNKNGGGQVVRAPRYEGELLWLAQWFY